MAQEDGGGSPTGAEEGQGAGGPEGGDQIPEETRGRARPNDLLTGGGHCAAKQCERKKLSTQTHKFAHLLPLCSEIASYLKGLLWLNSLTKR